MLLKSLKSLYYKLRYDLPLWIDNHSSKPYLRIWKHKYFCKSEKAKRAALLRLYEITMGHSFDFDNPQSYNQKMQWLKLYGDIETETILADKYKVRDFVSKRIGEQYLVPLLGCWENPDDIDFNSLPDRFVLKANHGSGMNLIVKDKKSLNIPQTIKLLKQWLKTNIAWNYLELQYVNIPPRIIAEEYIENAGGDLYDYKVWCFDGKAYYIVVMLDREHGGKETFFDLQWNKQNFTFHFRPYEHEIPKPERLQELIDISEKLSRGFPHVRVDMYCLNDGSFRFGEMTFSSFMGLCTWDPPEMDMFFGKFLNLPEKYQKINIED